MPRPPSPAEERETLLLRAALAGLLVATALALTVWIRSSQPENLGWLWWQCAGIATVPGKYVIFTGLTEHSPMEPLGLACLCVAVDTALALALALFLGPLGRLPGIGPWLRNAHDSAGAVLAEYPRLRRMAFFGVVLFVFLPLPGTGAVGGMFAGQIIGLTRPQGALAVALGTLAIAGVFLGLALTLGAEAESLFRNPWVTGGLLAVFVLFVWGATRAVRSKLQRP